MGFNSGFKGLIRIPTRGDRLWCFFFRLITLLIILFGLVCCTVPISIFYSCKWRAEKEWSFTVCYEEQKNQNPQSEQKLFSLWFWSSYLPSAVHCCGDGIRTRLTDVEMCGQYRLLENGLCLHIFQKSLCIDIS